MRETDVAMAFQRAVQEVITLEPDLIFLVGDIFDRPDPPPGALVSLARGLEAFRSAIPSAQVFMVAGARDTPRPMTDPGALAALDPFPHVEAITGTARSIFLKELETHLYLVPHGAVVRRPYPEIRTHPDARWNILLAYAGVGTGAGPGISLDPGPWDYVALGHLHQYQEVAPRVYYSGSLERVGPEPWREAAQEKGFLTFDLESGEPRFHPIQGRPVVSLAPIRFPQGQASQLPGKVREVLGEVPGGIQGKIVRIRIEGLSPQEVKEQDRGLFAPLREEALHLAIEVDDFHSQASDNPLPLVARDRGFALRTLRDRVREVEGEGTLSLLAEMTGEMTSSGEPPGLEEELLLRELRGTDLPYLGSVAMEAQEGLLAWMGGDGRILRAFTGTLLWAVGLESDLPGPPMPSESQAEPGAAIRIGIRDGSFWMRKGAGDGGDNPESPGPAGREWGLPARGVALAWCGAGGDSPEEVLDTGGALLATARGVEELAALRDELLERHPGLRRDSALEELSARDYERLRLESELSDLMIQLRALEDVPQLVAGLEAELQELRASSAEVAGDLEAGAMDWHRERQDAETHLGAYRDRARELKARISKLDSLRADSPCPTCGRILGDHFEEVREELRDEWEALVQDGRWWRRRWEQLEGKPQELKDLESRNLRINNHIEDCAERLEQARSSLREMDDLRLREREISGRLELLAREERGSREEDEDTRILEEGAGWHGPEPPEEARALFEVAGTLHDEILRECRVRLMHRGGRRLNRLSGGRILGLEREDDDGSVNLVEGGSTAGVEADEDRAAALVALRMALAELLAEDWSPLGSFVLGDPFDRMGVEDQVRALNLLRRILSRIPQIVLLTRGSVVERAPEFFDGLFEFREDPARGLPPLRALPSGVGILKLR